MAEETPRPTRAQRRRALGVAILLGGVSQGRTVTGRLGSRGARKSSKGQKPVKGGGYK
ncbi:MAG: hypothetical protein ACR2OV_15925 [Hyphomicrobiaceae bacterium]